MVHIEFTPQNSKLFLEQALEWIAHNFDYMALFQGNGLNYPHDSFAQAIYAGTNIQSLEQLTPSENPIVGIVSYDYKNIVEKLSSENEILVDVPDSLFFEAILSIEWNEQGVCIKSSDPDYILNQIQAHEVRFVNNSSVVIQSMTSRDQYIANVEAIRQHIEEGDVYELNYCLAYAFEAQVWNPIQAFRDLMELSPMPFSVFFKSHKKYLIGASPERFLKKKGNTLIAQPIKGTIRRGLTKEEDTALATTLLNSEKERAENLMIVDLMRNDLSKVSNVGSVAVEELFGVYPFPRVHQMISTVASELKAGVSIQDIFKATFPMGSMTGAPKVKCMELIERYEDFRRGWYSGSVGLISPSGAIDFNVIIRSIIFDEERGKGYFAVGSAITYDADPAYEFEECQLKASAIRQVLEGTVSNEQ